MVNGFFVAYVGMPSFVVTLGMLSLARSLAVVFSANQMLYKFGPDAPIVKAIGQAKWPLHRAARLGAGLDAGNLLAFLDHGDPDRPVRRLRLQFHRLGPHLFAIGGNEQAARMTGVPVNWIKFQTYVFSAFTATVASLLLLGYTGSAINAMGQGYELAVIAATVIGGANLMGGAGTGLWRDHRLGLAGGDPQRAADGGHRFQLAGRLRRRLHRSRGASRNADRRSVVDLDRIRQLVPEEASLGPVHCGNQ
jgi:ribose transport system permease protein